MGQEILEKFRITKNFFANHPNLGLTGDKILELGVCCQFCGPASSTHVLLAMGRIKPVLKITRSGAMMDREILKQNY